jgi:3,4-dihydroxy-9,10-secoandrosta-1,3,5(10)-triene-9,17-dione 4,5-dioxygenase
MELRGLGYVGVNATRVDAWDPVAAEVFGFQPVDGPPGAADVAAGTRYYKLDGHSWRVAVHPSSTDGFAYAGWELADPASFADAVASVRACGVSVTLVDGPDRVARGVQELARFHDPFGNTHELFWGPHTDEFAFASPAGVSGFVTDGVGLGHVLYVVPSRVEAVDFFSRALGFRLTDQFVWGPNGASFMHATPRHHSIAFIDLPLPGGPGLNHFMVEALTLEDVGCAFDRARAAGVPIINSLGQHYNDPMLSFYVVSPGGFNIEFGWKGLMIDESTWTVRTYTGRGELWGHTGEFMDSIAEAKME